MGIDLYLYAEYKPLKRAKRWEFVEGPGWDGHWYHGREPHLVLVFSGGFSDVGFPRPDNSRPGDLCPEIRERWLNSGCWGISWSHLSEILSWPWKVPVEIKEFDPSSGSDRAVRKPISECCPRFMKELKDIGRADGIVRCITWCG